jgi:hypothetical protein
MKKSEIFFCIVFCFLFTAIPLTVKELYPFSAATMFAYDTTEYVQYEIFDPQNNLLSEADFGLQMNVAYDPPVKTLGRNGYGKKYPFSINHFFGDIPTNEEIINQVSKSLEEKSNLPYVKVKVSVVSSKDSNSVGVVKEEVLTIHNPKVAL